MKITRKLYQDMYAERGQLKRAINDADQEERFDTWRELIEKLPKIEEFFENLPKVLIEFTIGHRDYYREVVKIGKTYFQHGEAMTKGRGYWCINEIAEITPQMKDDMMADSYYY
tara:strand:+ start:129 stop:470 length:342 start_codon:yes stop_codon:yes gene_type:complete